MPERVPHRRSRWRGLLSLATVLVVTGAAAACSESLDGGAACPALCPSQSEAFRDTTIDAVALDTSIQGFPTLGLSAVLLVANRPDTLVTHTVMRFDVLATSFIPNKTGAIDSVTTVDSVFLAVPLDTTGRLGSNPVTIEAYDVDTTASDTVSTVVRSLFRPDRRIGALTVVPTATGDSLRIPISKAFMERKIAAKSRVRVGLRIAQGNGQIRVRAFQFGAGAPTLRYDPTTDTTYSPVILNTNTSIANVPTDINLSYQVYPITDVGSPVLPPQTLAVGGYPAYRTYLRFTVPARITDTATIVRAELVLTQRRSRFGNANDTVTIVPLVPTTTGVVADLRRVLDLSAEGALAAVDTARMVPSDSGQRTLNVLALARTWRTLPTNVPRALAFRIGLEGAQPAELRFFSSEAPSALRPKLRITYLPRSEFALP
jgi:hypothetical protein